jgi:carboxylesterase
MPSYLIPQSEPFYLPGAWSSARSGEQGGCHPPLLGCLLLHGFTATPEEMRPLGDDLHARGYTVLGQRLAGHATTPADLSHTRWVDWLADVEDGLSILSATCERIFLIGQSMGGMIALTAAGTLEPAPEGHTFSLAGVIALSTPYPGARPGGLAASVRRSVGRGLGRSMLRLASLLRPMAAKQVERFAPDHPLYARREANYPAYPQYPTRIYFEIEQLQDAMHAALPDVKVPVLLIQSTTDPFIPPDSIQRLYDRLGTDDKRMLQVEGMDHSLTQDPQRQPVFDAIAEFMRTHDVRRTQDGP